MKLSISKIDLIVLFIVFLMLCTSVKDALSCDNDCRYERKKFIAQQMIKHKMQERYSLHLSPVLVGADALFL